MKKSFIIITFIALIFQWSPLRGWDDLTLLTSASAQLKPNIMFILDNSGSMNTVICPPFYQANNTYTGPGCDFVDPTETYKIKKFGNKYYFIKLGDDKNQLYGLDKVPSISYAVELNYKDCNGTDSFFPNQGIYFYPLAEAQEEPRYPGNLLNFLLYYATPHQLIIWNHFMIYGNFNAGQGKEISPGVYNPAPTLNGGDNTDPDIQDMHKYTGHDNKIRIKVARKVMTHVLYDIYNSFELDPTPDKKRPRIGLTIFEHAEDPEGGTLQQKCQDNSAFDGMAANVGGILANSWTPLSECYAETWGYFRHGGQAHINDDKYFLPLDDPSSQTISSNRPITNWCQLNFILVITDGESTKDTGLRDLTASNPSIIFNTNKMDTWGDSDGTGDDDDSATLKDLGTNYLDDLAYYAYNEDLYPDKILEGETDYETVYKNKQFIYTYAIGFAIDNYLLRQTAKNGGGEFFSANNYEELLKSLKAALSSIDEKVNAYAAFAAPKYSTFTDGAKGYVATFIPRNLQNIWEGHLKCYMLDYEGNFPSDLDNPGQVQVLDENGNPQWIDSFQWDAGQELNARTTARTIYTAVGNSLVEFTDINVGPTELGFDSGDTALDAQDAAKVIDFISGNNGYDWTLGDVFHFTPLVVGAPIRWKAAFDASYAKFYDYWTEEKDGKIVSKRLEVIYAGANDGMLHCFRVDTGEELWGFIPPSLLTKLKHSVPDVTGSLDCHNYFVDGKAIAKDIKVANNGTYDDWHTVLIFGFGAGGNAYCALDITDPENPDFLWEFTDTTYLGQTEAKPIVTDIANDGNGLRVPAAILSGGFDPEELPTVPAKSKDPTSLTGKAFYVLHAYDGSVIKQFIYDSKTSNPDTATSGLYTHTNAGFKYCFASTPTVIDKNNNGIGDFFYMYESGDYRGTAGEGGRIWKVNLSGSPKDWRPSTVFQAADGQTLFLPATAGYDDNYNFWLLFGTGHRPSPNHADNLTGQFIGFIDNGTISTPLTLANLVNISTDYSGANDTEFSLLKNSGFYFNFLNGTREIIFDPNPIYLNSQVLFNTYAPDAVSNTDMCNPPGNQYIYSFYLDSSGGTISITDPTVESGKIQGHGSLTGGKYKIYTGQGEVGSPEVKSQDTIDMSELFGPMFWIENKK